MATSQPVRTASLGQGWFASENEDGSYTLRNADKGQRIDLDAESVATFTGWWKEEEAALNRTAAQRAALAQDSTGESYDPADDAH